MPELVEASAAGTVVLRELAQQGKLFALLDACDEPRVPVKVRQLGAEATPLYQGRAQEDLWAIAPYLTRVSPNTLEWIVESFWGDPWGVFVITEATLEDLRTHFRRFLLVDGPAGEQWYFRFYDPRVLAKFLAMASAEQVAELFGPVTQYAWVDPATYGVQLRRRKWFEPAAHQTPRIVYRRHGS